MRLGGPGSVVRPVGAVPEQESQVAHGRGTREWYFRLSLGDMVPAVEKQMAWCLGKCGCFKKVVEDHHSRIALGLLSRVLAPLSSLGDFWGPWGRLGDC